MGSANTRLRRLWTLSIASTSALALSTAACGDDSDDLEQVLERRYTPGDQDGKE